jgi:hypothetical protein
MPGNKTANLELAATALAVGQNVAGAAQAANVTTRTIRRWLAESPLRAQVATLRAEMLSEATGILSRTMAAAAIRLGELIDNEDPRVAFSAARAVLELALRIREQGEIDQRLAALEEALRERDRVDQPPPGPPGAAVGAA